MTEFRVLAEPELRPILDLLTSLPEHTPLTEPPGIMARCVRLNLSNPPIVIISREIRGA
jgi:hypothetical protein